MWPFKKKEGKDRGVTVRLKYTGPKGIPMVLAPDRTNVEDVKFIEQWFKDIRRQIYAEKEPAIGRSH